MATEARLAKYNTVVYPMNRHSGYGKPVTVFATNPQDAIDRAIEIGWNGRGEHARVLIRGVEDLDPRTALLPESQDSSSEGADRG